MDNSFGSILKMKCAEKINDFKPTYVRLVETNKPKKTKKNNAKHQCGVEKKTTSSIQYTCKSVYEQP